MKIEEFVIILEILFPELEVAHSNDTVGIKYYGEVRRGNSVYYEDIKNYISSIFRKSVPSNQNMFIVN